MCKTIKRRRDLAGGKKEGEDSERKGEMKWCKVKAKTMKSFLGFVLMNVLCSFSGTETFTFL